MFENQSQVNNIILAQNLQTQRRRKQTQFIPSSYPLSAHFGLLVVVDLALALMTPWSLQRMYSAAL